MSKLNFLKFLLFLCLFSCQSDSVKKNITIFSGNAMTIDYRITVGQNLNTKQEEKVKHVILGVFQEINDIFNKWNPDSELSRLNKLKANQIVPISAEMVYFLQEISKIVKITQGRFDPSVEPILQLWKKEISKGKCPSQEEINKIMPAIGWQNIHVENGRFYKDHDLTEMDLGGIAKGYCVDLMIEKLKVLGIENMLVEWGGELRASGKHPSNRAWKISISSPNNPDPAHAIAYIDLNDQAIATSGNYIQNWNVNNEKYCHILNPLTGHLLKMTPSSIASASVIAPTCAFADGLATALLFFDSKEEAIKWAESLNLPNVSVWVY